MKCRVSESLLRKYLAGDSLPGTDKLVAIARAADADLDWLASGEGTTQSHVSTGPHEASYCVPPALNDIGRAESSTLGSNRTNIAFSTEWVKRDLGLDPAHVAVFVVRGDAMAPSLDTGHTLLIDTTQKEVTDDSIYVIKREGVPVAKRLQKTMDGSVHVGNDNPAYVDERLDRQQLQTLEIMGKVIWVGGRL